MPAVIPCQLNTDLEAQILQYAETLKTDAGQSATEGIHRYADPAEVME